MADQRDEEQTIICCSLSDCLHHGYSDACRCYLTRAGLNRVGEAFFPTKSRGRCIAYRAIIIVDSTSTRRLGDALNEDVRVKQVNIIGQNPDSD